MIFTVTLYPALDKVSVVRDFEVDGVSMTERSRQSPGGQGIQISSVLQGLGARTVAMGLIGGAAGDWIRDQLDLMGVPNDFTFTAHETRTNLTILDPDNDTCTRILEPGPPVTAENLQELWEKLEEQVRTGDMVVFAGKNPAGVTDHQLADWITVLRDRGIRTALDTAGMAMKIGVAAGPTVIRPDRAQLEALCEKELPDREALAAAAHTVAANGVERVVVTLNHREALFVTAGESYHVCGPILETAAARGAADALLASVLWDTEQGTAWQETARRAVAVSMAHAACTGGAPVTLDDVEDLYTQMVVEPLS